GCLAASKNSGENPAPAHCRKTARVAGHVNDSQQPGGRGGGVPAKNHQHTAETGQPAFPRSEYV
ncbi:TPA: hypothetical protein ACF26I_005436, partial [Escherichia coli]